MMFLTNADLIRLVALARMKPADRAHFAATIRLQTDLARKLADALSRNEEPDEYGADYRRVIRMAAE